MAEVRPHFTLTSREKKKKKNALFLLRLKLFVIVKSVKTIFFASLVNLNHFAS